ncbi:MAG TPA: hypothetical protein VML75_03100 [Kofleriaceae bacterium]|nr:hypothetical protein [Kofleriaceae bacterium]
MDLRIVGLALAVWTVACGAGTAPRASAPAAVPVSAPSTLAEEGAEQPAAAGEPEPEATEGPDPDPDEEAYLEGRITIPTLSAKQAATGCAFVVARAASEDDVVIARQPPIAAHRFSAPLSLPLEFRLTNDHVLLSNMSLAGYVQLSAFYDDDCDVLTKNPGDLLGAIFVHVSAADLEITVDAPRTP